MSSLKVLINTCSSSEKAIKIGYTLLSLALQRLPTNIDFLDINILDEGNYSLNVDQRVNLIINILKTKGHRVCVIRNEKENIALTRKTLLDTVDWTKHKYALIVDDDLVLNTDAVLNLMESIPKTPWGFIQGTKIEVNPDKQYNNDINILNTAQIERSNVLPLLFGDAACLLLSVEGFNVIDWGVATKNAYNNIAGEDVVMSLQVSNVLPCYGATQAVGYHIAASTPRWDWETPTDILSIRALLGVVSTDILREVFPHLEELIEKEHA